MQYSFLSHFFFSFLWSFLKKHKKKILLYCLLSFFAGFSTPFNSFLMQLLINLITTDATMLSLSLTALGIVTSLVLFENVTWRSITYIRANFVPQLISEMSQTLLNHTLHHPYQFFQTHMVGDITKKIANITEASEQLFSQFISHSIRMISLCLLSIVFASTIHPIFALVLSLWIISFLIISYIMSQKFITLSAEQNNTEDALSANVNDSLTNYFNVQIYNNIDKELEIQKEKLKEWQNKYKEKEYYAILLHSVQGAMLSIIISLGLFFLLFFYKKGYINIGNFAFIISTYLETVYMLWWTAGMIEQYNKVIGKAQESLSFLLSVQQKNYKELTNTSNENLKENKSAAIFFDKVMFAYENKEPIFNHLSLTIKQNEKIGLVGTSGAGKTTLANLLIRMYNIQEGGVYIRGKSIYHMPLGDLRDHIAMVTQDTLLFNRSIFDNIKYGKINATHEDVYAAARAANAHDFITTLPEGYESRVGDRGIKLSGGQRQRIIIARAILKNASILILDEATSQLDSVTEKYIQASLEHLMKERTSIVIAHRLSTLLSMDRILVFDQGNIVESGSHNELLKKDGVYKKLWETQFFIKNN
jgi:ATP-binding cassette subfamily B protein